MATNYKNERLMSSAEPSIPALDETRQLNRVFLDYLRAEPEISREHLGLSDYAAEVLQHASPAEIERAADFPRALFRLRIPAASDDVDPDPLGLVRGTTRWALHLTLLHIARHLSRLSGYSARLLLRLEQFEVRHLRTASVGDVLTMSLANDLVRAEFGERDWIWRELLTETRPELRRQLILIGFQPDLVSPTATEAFERRGIRI
jgi:hypothetical protein